MSRPGLHLSFESANKIIRSIRKESSLSDITGSKSFNQDRESPAISNQEGLALMGVFFPIAIYFMGLYRSQEEEQFLEK